MNDLPKSENNMSWGRVLRATHHVGRPVYADQLDEFVAQAAKNKNGLLATGLGRSYGTSGLNDHGAAIDMTALDRICAFNTKTGIIQVQAGCTLADILQFAIPRGYFLPVTPGTSYVTLGGAIANDVHGKNHAKAGTIGRWVREIELLRTDGTIQLLTPKDKTGLFAATIGGFGLTGVISRISLELKPIQSSQMQTETIKFDDLDSFFEIAQQSDDKFEYTVAWIDCMAKGASLGRGLFSRGNHTPEGDLMIESPTALPSVPMDAPGFLLNKLSIAAFNALYFARGGRQRGVTTSAYRPFFYPLDAIGQWNRLYGKRGMYQYQSVVPPAVAKDATREMLQQIAKAGQGSFLAVLKTLGDIASPGLMSFPMEGTTLALDFPNKGAKTRKLLSRLDDVVREAGGRNYPAKDGRIPIDMIENGFENFGLFTKHLDPNISSSFWRRIRETS